VKSFLIRYENVNILDRTAFCQDSVRRGDWQAIVITPLFLALPQPTNGARDMTLEASTTAR
jgi:hypothetical protein